jgi:urease accessory protein
MHEPLLLSRRLDLPPAAVEGAPGSAGMEAGPGIQSAPEPPPLLVLALTASERQRLRGHCRSRCGHDLLLQLPRGGGPLIPGERLAAAEGPALVRVEAAAEELLLARSDDPFTLLRAAYHLGNRHVALELRLGELRLLQDPVLADLLQGLGVSLEAITAPFAPESGAYTAGHSHAQSPSPSHSHGHSHGEANGPDHDAAPGGPARHHSHGAGSRKEGPGEHHHPHRP